MTKRYPTYSSFLRPMRRTSTRPSAISDSVMFSPSLSGTWQQVYQLKLKRQQKKIWQREPPPPPPFPFLLLPFHDDLGEGGVNEGSVCMGGWKRGWRRWGEEGRGREGQGGEGYAERGKGMGVGGLQRGRGTNDASFTINYSAQVVIY